ncbi:MAG: sugar phosphate isomerase/epimerase [Clostridia bacterium]|nr:sugar phosphate isomerase/epimerase [Clostridia bacterium]
MDSLLCMNISKGFHAPYRQQIDMLKAAGFDGFFMGYAGNEQVLRDCAAYARECGMIFQSLHAPFDKMRIMWCGGEEEAQEALDELLKCLEICAQEDIPLLVVHAFIGFEDHTPTAAGIERFGKLVAAAEKTNVLLAFENTEGEEYLDALLQFFRRSPAVGFCWDSGHEQCYNHGQDLIKKYGDRLLCTHINDNLGIRDHDGKITWLDDLHLLPFDGVIDWQDAANRLRKCGYQGALTMEMTIKSKPGRHDNDKYASMPLEQYFAACYARLCKIARLLEK